VLLTPFGADGAGELPALSSFLMELASAGLGEPTAIDALFALSK